MDTTQLTSFCDELIKIAEATDDNVVDRDRLKRFARYGLAAAGAYGVGHATGKLINRPITRALSKVRGGKQADKVLKYLVPITAGLGAGYGLARRKTTEEIHKRVRQRE